MGWFLFSRNTTSVLVEPSMVLQERVPQDSGETFTRSFQHDHRTPLIFVLPRVCSRSGGHARNVMDVTDVSIQSWDAIVVFVPGD
jgi:hypothetical protein